MPRQTKPLTEAAIRNAKPDTALWDGGGLHLIRRDGRLHWRLKYIRPDGRENRLALGPYPTVKVEVGGIEVPERMWDKIRPRAGVPVHVTVYPQGGNGGKWLRTILLIVVAVLAVYTGQLEVLQAEFGTAGAAAIGAAVGIVGSLLVNALVPPPTPKGLGGGGDPFSQLASITGTSNQANPYGVIPCVVGKMRF